MKNLLFLVHRIPFPPNKGDKIRSFHLLRQLSEEYNVYLAGFVDNEDDWKHVDELRKYCSDVYFRPISKWRSKFSAALSLLNRHSLSVGFYADSTLRTWVENTVREVKFDVAVSFSSSMTQFLPYDMLKETVIVADFVDLDSDKWNQYAAEVRWPMSSIYSYEAKALAKWEMDTVKLVDAVTLVSSAERQLLLDRCGENSQKIEVVRNGVDIQFFDPATEFDNPYEPGKCIAVFTGAMDYFANVQGVQWFAEEIWPRVKDEVPTAEFWIVGSKPAKEVEALQSLDGVFVTGFVDDVRPYLRHSNVVVVPLQLARGVQNKVLEALSMDLPVLATPQALRGLDGSLPDTVMSISDVGDFSKATSRALERDTRHQGGPGRAYVRDNYDWQNNLSEMERILSVATDREEGPLNSGSELK